MMRTSQGTSLGERVIEALTKANEQTDSGLAEFITRFGIERSWRVEPHHYPKVWQRICELAFDSVEHDADEEFRVVNDIQYGPDTLAISEIINGSTIPLIFNFKMRFAVLVDIPSKFILKVCAALTSTLQEAFPSVNTNQLYIAIISASEHLEMNGNIFEFHFRLQLPYFRIHTDSLAYVKRDFIKQMQSLNVLTSLGAVPINTLDEIISSPRSFHPIYKSDEGGFKQRLIAIVRSAGDESFEYYEAGSIFNTCYIPGFEDNGVFGPNWCSLQPTNFFLPLFLSISYASGAPPFVYQQRLRPTSSEQGLSIELEPETPGSSQHQVPPNFAQYGTDNPDKDPAEIALVDPRAIVKHLTYLIKAERFREHWSWLIIGKAICSAFKGSKEGLVLWESRSSHELRPQCKMLYYKGRNSGYNHETIAYIAREDSPREYEAWHMKIVKFFVMKACKLMNKHNIAKCFYWKFWLDYKCVSIETGLWARYDRDLGRFVAMEANSDVSNTISEDFANMFDRLQLDIQQSVVSSNSTAEKGEGRASAKAIADLVFKLGEPNFKSGILKELPNVGFFDPIFATKADKRGHLFSFPNGMLDISIEYKTRFFRLPLPQDYVFKVFTEIEYPSHFTWDSPEVKSMWKWLTQLIRDRDHSHLLHNAREAFELAKRTISDKLPSGSMPTLLVFVMYISSIFLRVNREKWVVFLFGDGNNGKSMFVLLLEYLFGTGAFKYPTWIVAGTGRGAREGGPTPELAQADRMNVGIAQEPKGNAEFSDDFLKMITGMDTFFARNCKKDGGKIEGTSKTLIMGNKKPRMPSAEPSIQRRFILFWFNSLWADDDDPQAPRIPDTEEEQYEKGIFRCDNFFKDRLEDMAPALAWICFEYLQLYLNGGMKKSTWMKDMTRSYWASNDVYRMFIGHCLEVGEKAKGLCETVYEVHAAYKTWFRKSNPGKDPHDIMMFTEEMNRTLGQQLTEDGLWKNLTIKTELIQL